MQAVLLLLSVMGQWDMSAFEEPVMQKTALQQAFDKSEKLEVPLVIVVSMDGCAPCKRLTNQLEDWKTKSDRAYVVVDYRSAWARSKLVETVPAIFIYPSPHKGGVSVRNFSPKSHTKAFINSEVEKMKPAKSKGTVITAVPVRGSIRGSWTYPGMPSATSLEYHLTKPPHNFSLEYLQTLSDSELARLHDSDHRSKSKRSYSSRRS